VLANDAIVKVGVDAKADIDFLRRMRATGADDERASAHHATTAHGDAGSIDGSNDNHGPARAPRRQRLSGWDFRTLTPAGVLDLSTLFNVCEGGCAVSAICFSLRADKETTTTTMQH
jgi:hypothetical protein